MKISKRKFFAILAIAILSTTMLVYATIRWQFKIENIVTPRGSEFGLNLYEEDNSTLISPHDWGELWKGEYKEWHIWLENASDVKTWVAWTQKNLPNTGEDTFPSGWELQVFRSDTIKGISDYYTSLGSSWQVEVGEKFPVTIRLWNHDAESDIPVNFAIFFLVIENL